MNNPQTGIMKLPKVFLLGSKTRLLPPLCAGFLIRSAAMQWKIGFDWRQNPGFSPAAKNFR